MCLAVIRAAARLLLLTPLPACGLYQKATTPAEPLEGDMPAVGRVPDSVLIKLIRGGDLIVLATPLDMVSGQGLYTPSMQLGATVTWFDVKLAVDSTAKGKLKYAKSPDLGSLPAFLKPPPPFGRLARNEIVVQYPAVASSASNSATLPPPTIGERAVYIFNKCYYCLPITGIAHGRGPAYTANPLVAQGWGSKLPPAEWSRVTRLLAELKRSRK
jgi:hypothetical protein